MSMWNVWFKCRSCDYKFVMVGHEGNVTQPLASIHKCPECNDLAFGCEVQGRKMVSPEGSLLVWDERD